MVLLTLELAGMDKDKEQRVRYFNEGLRELVRKLDGVNEATLKKYYSERLYKVILTARKLDREVSGCQSP